MTHNKTETVGQKFQLLRNCLATAEIVYHMPDYPELLQTFIWQESDLAPDLPALHRFLRFWRRNLDGRLHSVQVTTSQLVRASELHFADAEFKLQ